MLDFELYHQNKGDLVLLHWYNNLEHYF